MVERIAAAAAPRPFIPGREHAADERDQGDAMRAIVADGIEIPPDIAAWDYRFVKTPSAIICDAARRPERAAIGTPAPGWVAPPAR